MRVVCTTANQRPPQAVCISRYCPLKRAITFSVLPAESDHSAHARSSVESFTSPEQVVILVRSMVDGQNRHQTHRSPKEATGSKKRRTLLATSMYRIIGFNSQYTKKLLPTCTDLSLLSEVTTGIDDVSRPSSTNCSKSSGSIASAGNLKANGR